MSLETLKRSGTVILLAALLAAAATITLTGQGGGGQGQGGPGGPGGRGQAPGGRGQAAPSNLPTAPTAVALPTMSAEVTGPGAMFDSTPSLPPGKGLAAFRYEAKEYFVAGTANGQPYNTRIVVRKPANSSAFSGLVLAESMHGSGAAHMFEFTSIYTMSSGHAAVEILTTSPMQFVQQNEARYRDLRVAGGQANEIIAQVGALIRTGRPLGGLPVRKMVLAGTSMSAGTLINYLPAHMVYRTPEMQRIFDGFMPTSNGALDPGHRCAGGAPADDARSRQRQHHQSPGRRRAREAVPAVRVFGHRAHRHARQREAQAESVRAAAQRVPESGLLLGRRCTICSSGSTRAPCRRGPNGSGSIATSTTTARGWSSTSTAIPRGGIRNTYVDVPTAKYTIRPAAITPVIPNAQRLHRRRRPGRGESDVRPERR